MPLEMNNIGPKQSKMRQYKYLQNRIHKEKDGFGSERKKVFYNISRRSQ